MSEMIAKAAEQSRSERRFTGSREDGSFTGLNYPVTSGVDQGKIRLDTRTWTLTIRGNIKKPVTLNYETLLALSTSEVTATIDCTGGWYSTQVWRGVRLADLLSQAEIESEDYILLFKDVSGYTAYFTPADVSEILLATHAGNQALNHWHGFPLRAVVPSRRGGHWVKWLTEVEVI
jgi:DMSO/TMAO reductase YedYZ molybdopterin-dependent catalytic subunit